MPAMPTLLVLIGMSIGYLLFLKILMDRQIITLRPLIVMGLAGFVIFVEIFFLISRFIQSQVVLWLFDLDKEKNLPSTFSSVVLLMVGITGLWIGIRLAVGRVGWKKTLYWLLLGALFTFFAFDEYYFIHERIPSWHRLYAVLGGITVGYTVLMGGFFDRQNLRLYALIVLGLISLGIGGVGFDFAGTPIPFGYLFRYTVEEFLEYIGMTITLFAALTYFQRHFDISIWRLAGRVLPAAAAFWIISSIFWTFWPPSWVEIQTSAERVTIDFLDGDLSLVAIRIENDGRQINVSEYWRANAELYGTYAHALKLLDPATDALVVQANIGMQPRIPPTEGWIPGLIYKKEAVVPLDGVAPGEYTLALQAWVEPAAVEMLAITHTDHELVQPDTVVLGEITVSSE